MELLKAADATFIASIEYPVRSVSFEALFLDVTTNFALGLLMPNTGTM